MASVFTAHLEQIGLCSQSIAELPFPGGRTFTNAIIATNDITALIRDTEAHERALFHLAPPTLPTDVSNKSQVVAPISSAALKNRRSTMHPARQPKSRAVAAVLGGDLYARIQSSSSRQAGEVDVVLLLQGAEKLAKVYPIAGALDKIAQLKRRHVQLQANIAYYEGRISEQSLELDKMRGPTATSDRWIELDEIDDADPIQSTVNQDWTTVQDDIEELERKKKNLEARVTGMEKDLGGLQR